VAVNLDLTTVAVAVVGSSFGVAIAFYVKDYLEGRAAYRRLRARLERIAGKNATVVYESPQSTQIAPKATLYRIQEFDADGVVLKNDLHTIFVPIQAVLDEDIILPCDNYEDEIRKREREEMNRFMDLLLPEMMKRIFQTMKQELTKEFGSQGTELNAVIGIQVTKALQESGLEVRKLPAPSEKK
jgi:hypothetical protein